MSEDESAIYDLVSKWKRADSCLEAAAALEAKARLELTAAIFPEISEGVQSHTLSDGRVVKVTGKLNYKLADQKAIEAVCKKMEKADPKEGAFFVSRLVKTKFSLAVGEFKKLPPKLKAIFEKVVTISPGMPSLEIIEPEGE